MDATTILYLLVGLLLINYVVDQSLAWLNLRHSRTSLPKRLRDVYEEEEYERSQRYQSTSQKFSFITSTISIVTSLLVLSLGGFGYLDGLLREYFTDEIFLSLVFFVSLFILSDLVNIPFQLYSVFVIEEKFGFNKTTPKTFVLDKLKGYLMGVLLGGGLGYVLLWLIQELGSQFWLYALGVMALFMLVMNLFYTSLILPLFNKLTPLQNGPLKEEIEEYAQKVNFPLDNIFVLDGSKRSTKANAFFSGLGKKKKVVLYDTLIEKQSTEEIIAVIAHEVGHFKKKHIVLGLVLSLLQMSIMLYVLSLLVLNTDLSLALGGDQMAVHLNLIAFGMLFSPISRLTGLVMNVLSRKNEFEADAYAAETYAAAPLQKSLKKLSATSLSNLSPHPAYVFMNYSHPPLIKRLEALDAVGSAS